MTGAEIFKNHVRIQLKNVLESTPYPVERAGADFTAPLGPNGVPYLPDDLPDLGDDPFGGPVIDSIGDDPADSSGGPGDFPFTTTTGTFDVSLAYTNFGGSAPAPFVLPGLDTYMATLGFSASQGPTVGNTSIDGASAGQGFFISAPTIGKLRFTWSVTLTTSGVAAASAGAGDAEGGYTFQDGGIIATDTHTQDETTPADYTQTFSGGPTTLAPGEGLSFTFNVDAGIAADIGESMNCTISISISAEVVP